MREESLCIRHRGNHSSCMTSLHLPTALLDDTPDAFGALSYALTLTTSTPEAPVTSACLAWPGDSLWALQPACHCVGGQGIYTSWEGPPP